jgi:hypothetical protein
MDNAHVVSEREGIRQKEAESGTQQGDYAGLHEFHRRLQHPITASTGFQSAAAPFAFELFRLFADNSATKNVSIECSFRN